MEIAQLYRVYKGTVQRVLLSLDSLSSLAGFLLVVKEDKRVLCWIGSCCEVSDREAVKEMGWKVIARDFNNDSSYDDEDNLESMELIMEGEEHNVDSQPLFEMLLDLLWTNKTFYFSRLHVSNRQKPISNSPISVGYIEPVSVGSSGKSSRSMRGDVGVNDPYRFVETAFAHPNKSGGVHRITFIPIEADKIAYVNIGDLWEVWIAENVSDDESDKAFQFVSNKVALQLKLPNNASRIEILKQYIQVIHHGSESYLFKQYFKKSTTFTARIAPRPISNSALNKKDKEMDEVDGKDEDDGEDKEKDEGNDEGVEEQELNFYQSKPITTQAVIGRELEAVDFNSTSSKKVLSSTMMMMIPTLTLLEYQYPRVKSVDTSKVVSDMFAIKEAAQVSMAIRRDIITETASCPSSLIGYQISIEEGAYRGVFVVVSTKKTGLTGASLFGLLDGTARYLWLRLKRNNKSGYRWFPLRRVFITRPQ